MANDEERVRSYDAVTGEPHDDVLRTRSGKVLGEADIQRLAEEAEQGYDVDDLREQTAGSEVEVLAEVLMEHSAVSYYGVVQGPQGGAGWYCTCRAKVAGDVRWDAARLATHQAEVVLASSFVERVRTTDSEQLSKAWRVGYAAAKNYDIALRSGERPGRPGDPYRSEPHAAGEQA